MESAHTSCGAAPISSSNDHLTPRCTVAFGMTGEYKINRCGVFVLSTPLASEYSRTYCTAEAMLFYRPSITDRDCITEQPVVEEITLVPVDPSPAVAGAWHIFEWRSSER
jgi:hypothetical protein